jgi:hypothetical protein
MLLLFPSSSLSGPSRKSNSIEVLLPDVVVEARHKCYDARSSRYSVSLSTILLCLSLRLVSSSFCRYSFTASWPHPLSLSLNAAKNLWSVTHKRSVGENMAADTTHPLAAIDTATDMLPIDITMFTQNKVYNFRVLSHSRSIQSSNEQNVNSAQYKISKDRQEQVRLDQMVLGIVRRGCWTT